MTVYCPDIMRVYISENSGKVDVVTDCDIPRMRSGFVPALSAAYGSREAGSLSKELRSDVETVQLSSLRCFKSEFFCE